MISNTFDSRSTLICALIFSTTILAGPIPQALCDSTTSSSPLKIRATSSLLTINLGSASTYAVFAFTGIATVPGTLINGDIITGDIGVAPIALTAITGYGALHNGQVNPPLVVGTVYGPPHTTQTHADVLAAYKSANSKAPTFPLNLKGGLLDSMTLTPGVYRWASTLILSAAGRLTLKGNCGDVFILQASGAISTGANSNVILSGTLTSASVYWIGATTFNMGVGSTFYGIVMTGTNAVIAGTLYGAIYAQTEVALHKASITLPSSTC